MILILILEELSRPWRILRRNDLHMTVERYVSDKSVDGLDDDEFIRK